MQNCMKFSLLLTTIYQNIFYLGILLLAYQAFPYTRNFVVFQGEATSVMTGVRLKPAIAATITMNIICHNLDDYLLKD